MKQHDEHQSNTSATNGFIWEEYNFNLCVGNEAPQYIWASCSMLFFAFGFPAAVATSWYFFKKHRSGTPLTPNCLFMLNITAMDTVFLSVLPFGMINHFTFQVWEVEAFWNACYGLSTCGRPLLMACVCLDCYLAVVHPILFHKTKSLTPRIVMVLVVWILTIATGIIYFLYFKLFFSVFPIVFFMLTIVIIGICDSLILYTLNTSDGGRKNIHPQKKRAIHTLTNSLVVVVISYLPPVLLYVIGLFTITDNTLFMCMIGFPTATTSTLGSAVMPILALHNLGKINVHSLKCCK